MMQGSHVDISTRREEDIPWVNIDVNLQCLKKVKKGLTAYEEKRKIARTPTVCSSASEENECINKSGSPARKCVRGADPPCDAQQGRLDDIPILLQKLEVLEQLVMRRLTIEAKLAGGTAELERERLESHARAHEELKPPPSPGPPHLVEGLEGASERRAPQDASGRDAPAKPSDRSPPYGGQVRDLTPPRAGTADAAALNRSFTIADMLGTSTHSVRSATRGRMRRGSCGDVPAKSLIGSSAFPGINGPVAGSFRSSPARSRAAHELNIHRIMASSAAKVPGTKNRSDYSIPTTSQIYASPMSSSALVTAILVEAA